MLLRVSGSHIPTFRYSLSVLSSRGQAI